VISGDAIGPYLVLEPLGAGGMGEVYRARDTRLNREVALKRLSDRALATDVARRRVLREARAAAALSHPNIATIFDVLETPDGLVIVMEYVPGESLAARLARGPVPVEAALAIASAVADALGEAHQHGVIHRDLKPANIQLTREGAPKILDFGVARSRADESARQHESPDDPASQAGRVVGTPGYMAPEQLAGVPSDERTDIHALGVLLFEMLTGRRPYPASDPLGAALKLFEGRPPRVLDILPTIDPELSALVERAMARDPTSRFPSARDLGHRLTAVGRRLSAAPTISASDRPPLTTRRQPGRVAIIVGGLVLIVALSWSAGLLRHRWAAPLSAHSSVVGMLPFRNGSGDPTDDVLVVGLTDAVERRLASVDALRVVSVWNSGEASADLSDPVKAARDLGATFVIDGTLRRTGQTLSLDVSLVDRDGVRRPAGRYRGDTGNLFDFHRQVAEGLAAALNQEGAMPVGATPRARQPTADQDAFADYSQARLFLERPDVAGNVDRAIQLFQSAISRDSRFALAHAGLGEAYWAKYKETKAAEWTARATAAILEALSLDADQPEVRLSLAVMYQGLGRVDEAVAELRHVIQMQPNNDDPHRLLGGIDVDRGQWNDAVAELKRAIDLRSNYWRNYSELGYAYYSAGRLEEAAQAYHRVTELQPDSWIGFQTLGTVEQSAGKLAEAAVDYEKANAISPRASTYSNLGTVQYWQGDYAAAKQAYEQALHLAPDQPELLANLGDACLRLDLRDEAMAHYRAAIVEIGKQLTVNPNDASNLASLALYQAKAGRPDDAKASMTKALAINGSDGNVLYLRALVLALGGEKTGACGALEEAISRGASVQLVRFADELRGLQGCQAYDRVLGRGQGGEDHHNE
jgi:eukaryotic-like serine/threonine-protein kinase